MTTTRLPASTLLSCLTVLALAACGSSEGARCPDGPPPPDARPCPECPPPPRSAPPAFVIGAETMPIDREQRVSLVAFSEDGRVALVRIEDDAVGDLFKTVDLTSGPVPKLIKTWFFQSLTEPVALRQALRAIKPQAPPPASQQNAAGVTLVAADHGAKVLVYAMKGERAVPIAELPRLKDADGVPADVSVAKLAWDPSGTRAVVIHGQRLAAAPGFESQWMHVLQVDPSLLPF